MEPSPLSLAYTRRRCTTTLGSCVHRNPEKGGQGYGVYRMIHVQGTMTSDGLHRQRSRSRPTNGGTQVYFDGQFPAVLKRSDMVSVTFARGDSISKDIITPAQTLQPTWSRLYRRRPAFVLASSMFREGIVGPYGEVLKQTKQNIFIGNYSAVTIIFISQFVRLPLQPT